MSGASATHLASSATRPASLATAPIANASITPLPRPSLGAPSLKAPGWEGVVVRTICLNMRLSLTDPAVEGAVEQGLMDTLVGLGITTVEVGGSCEATIAVALTGKALSAQYNPLGLAGPERVQVACHAMYDYRGYGFVGAYEQAQKGLKLLDGIRPQLRQLASPPASLRAVLAAQARAAPDPPVDRSENSAPTLTWPPRSACGLSTRRGY